LAYFRKEENLFAIKMEVPNLGIHKRRPGSIPGKETLAKKKKKKGEGC
jgi:hypothetical protein